MATAQDDHPAGSRLTLAASGGLERYGAWSRLCAGYDDGSFTLAMILGLTVFASLVLGSWGTGETFLAFAVCLTAVGLHRRLSREPLLTASPAAYIGERSQTAALALTVCVMWGAAVMIVGVASPILPIAAAPATAACKGTHVAVGSNLARVVRSRPPRTTFCLAPGRYDVNDTITMKNGDHLIGAGRDQTFIVGHVTDILYGKYTAVTGYSIEHLDISGAGSNNPLTANCKPDCGTAIVPVGVDYTATVTISDVRCHDNATKCVGPGAANVVMLNSECDHNGYHPSSLEPSNQDAGCIKTNRGSLTVRNSYIHDNYWSGIWCDYCDHTTWRIVDNIIEDNGGRGIHWEISGELTTDSAVIRRNVISGNGWNMTVWGLQFNAGIVITGGRNITIENNAFGQNTYSSTDEPDGQQVCCRAIFILDDLRAPWEPNVYNVVISNNALDGDALEGCSLGGVTCEANV